MTKLWDTGNTKLHPLVEKYTVGNDYLLDKELIKYDLKASIAHVSMLKKIGLLSNNEAEQLIKGLKEISKLISNGNFAITQQDEDGHTAIENYLTKSLGEVGKKIQTGRSRNDQILVTMRLYLKEHTGLIKKEVKNLTSIIDKLAEENNNVPMPGYTHTQKAMETTVGTWLDSFAAALKDSLNILDAQSKIINQNPLGSVSGFGEKALKLDRAETTKLLGFDKTQDNPIYCARSRGAFELGVLDALGQVMLNLGSLANDLVWFTAQEFSYFDLPPSFKTGSSAMPQKQNFDVLEIARANVATYFGYRHQLEGLIQKLLSGYNRDLQLTKEPTLRGIEIAKDTAGIMTLVMQNLIVNQENLKKACTAELQATEEAYKLVKGGLSFREAYKIAAKKYR